jgi:hypothetical protein
MLVPATERRRQEGHHLTQDPVSKKKKKKEKEKHPNTIKEFSKMGMGSNKT